MINSWLTYVYNFILYDPSTPMVFTQMSFWWFFLVVLFGYSFIYKNIPLRNGYLFIVSLFFYYKCSGIFIWLLVLSIIVNYFIGLGIAKSNKKWLRKIYVALSVLFCIVLLSYFKYAFFFIESWNKIFATHYDVKNYLALWMNQYMKSSQFDIRSLILPVGISFYSFQALSYIIDL